MKTRSLVVLLVTAIALSTLAVGEETDSSTYTSVGESMPEINFTTVDGIRISNETLKGSVVMLNFFATWCGPCRSELPHLEKDVWQAFKDEDFKLVVVGREHTAAELNAFRDETRFTFPLAADPKRATYGLFAEKWIPRNYVIDRDGTILFQSKGYDPGEFAHMITVIKDALSQEAAADRAESPESEASSVPSKLKSVTVSGETRVRVQHRDN